MTYIINTAETIAKYLRKGQLVSLESTTYPGTTDEILLPLFEKAGLRNGGKKFTVGKDFFLSFSPEREDPNNPNFNTATIPKVIGGVTPNCVEIGCTLYNQCRGENSSCFFNESRRSYKAYRKYLSFS